VNKTRFIIHKGLFISKKVFLIIIIRLIYNHLLKQIILKQKRTILLIENHKIKKQIIYKILNKIFNVLDLLKKALESIIYY